jgi:hypothetical protein
MTEPIKVFFRKIISATGKVFFHLVSFIVAVNGKLNVPVLHWSEVS